MNFFKSILSDDSDPPNPDFPHESDPNSPLKQQHRDDDSSSSDEADVDPANGWSFGGLIKTIAIRSESVIETYRRDLTEFGSGLKKETEIFRETASRAVKDLPASIEAGASAAQGALDGVLKSTAQIISKESLGFGSDGEPESPDTNRSFNSGRYSWFESQLSAIQSDVNTFCEEPEDVEDYRKWKLGFDLEENGDVIDGLIGKGGTLEGVYKRVVPSDVDHESFLCRYFYRVEKLKLQESVRANLVKRAISIDDEEELSWDFDDDDEGDSVVSDQKTNHVVKQEGMQSGSPDEKVNMDNGERSGVVESSERSNVDVSLDDKEVKSEEVAEVKRDEEVKPEDIMKEKNDEKVKSEGIMEGKSDEKVKSTEITEDKNDEKVNSEERMKEKDDEKVKPEGSMKEKDDEKIKNDEKVGVEEQGQSDIQVDASKGHQSKVEEEELGWDEIEDIGSGDEKQISATSKGSSSNRGDLPKRSSAAEDDDDDDLNWDIEDDDEPVKA